MISVQNEKYGVTNLKHNECSKNKLKHLFGVSDECKVWGDRMCRGGLIFFLLNFDNSGCFQIVTTSLGTFSWF